MDTPSTVPATNKPGMPPYIASEAPTLHLLNSLTGRKDPFQPIEGNQIKFYICGPTVDDSTNMGHARGYISLDIIRRVLTHYFHYDVNYVMNITDIDDKIIEKARQHYLFQQYAESNKGDFLAVVRDVMEAIKEFRDKVAFETSSDKKKMLTEICLRMNTVVASFEANMADKDFLKSEDRYKVEFKADSDRKEMLTDICLRMTTVVANLEANMADKDFLKSEDLAKQTADFLENTKEVLYYWLDKRLGSTVTDHSIFARFAKHFEDEFMHNMNMLNVLPPTILTRVSEHVDEIIEYVKKIVSIEYAYITSDGSVYFDTARFQANPKHFYAKLVPEAIGDTGNEAKHMKESEGELSIGVERQHGKNNNSDFALWKASKAGEPFWDSPWGKGRPGWHIECSVMRSSISGNKLDIHAGGFDLKFPHLENEIAQYGTYYDGNYRANFFLHCGTLRNARSEREKKNLIPIKRALEDYTARQLRICFLMDTWSDALYYSPQTMDFAIKFETYSIEFFMRVKDLVRRHQEINKENASSFKKFDDQALQLFNQFDAIKIKIHAFMCDSIDTKKVITSIRAIINASNSYIDMTDTGYNCNSDLLLIIANYITRMLRIFGVIPENNDIGYPSYVSGKCGNKEEQIMPYLSALVTFLENIQSLAREAKNVSILQECDRIRDEVLPKLGVRLEDRPNFTAIKLEDLDTVLKESSGEFDSKEEQIMPYLSAFVIFRDNIRSLAREAKNVSIFQECDRIRDEVLKLGVRFKDRSNFTAIKFEDLETVLKERAQKEAAVAAKEDEKRKKKKQQKTINVLKKKKN